MPVRRALIVEVWDERFRFYYDREEHARLHITARHGVTPEEAVRVFFSGIATSWDADRSRFVTVTERHCLYWARHAHDSSVIVISCFEIGDA